MKCVNEIKKNKKCCNNEDCRYWLDYNNDLNCTLICVEQNGNLTLEQISKRLAPLTPAGVSVIQKRAEKKIAKSKLLKTIYC